MKIIDRYVLVSFLKNYVISFVALVGMYVVLDMVFRFDELTDVKGNKGTVTGGGPTSVLATVLGIAEFYSYQTLLFFVHLSGIIPVVAAAFTLIRLSRFGELTAILAAGVPLLRVAMPIILAGVVLNALMIVDQEVVIPNLLDQLTRDHDEIGRTDAKWFQVRGMQGRNKTLLYAARYFPGRAGKSPCIQVLDVVEREEVERTSEDAFGREVRRNVYEAKAHVLADWAIWNGGLQRWDLWTVRRVKDDGAPGGAREEWIPGGRRVTGLSAQAQTSEVEPVLYYESNITPEEIGLYHESDWVELLSTSQIEALISRPGSYGQANLLRMKHYRFTQPIMNVILLLLAIPCVLTRAPGHLKQAATKCLVLTGLGMGTVFLSHQLAGQPGMGGSWAAHWPALMAWLPIFLWGPVAVFLLDRVKT